MLWLLAAVALAAPWEPTQPAAVDAYNKGVDALEAGDPNQAESLFAAAIEAQPEAGVPRLGLASAVLLQNRAQDAVLVLEALDRSFPKRTDVQLELSNAFFASQQFTKSMTAASSIVSDDPASVDGHVALIRALLRLGDYNRAGTALDTASKLGDKPEWACLRGMLEVERGDRAKAEALLPRCREEGGGLYQRLGTALDDQGLVYDMSTAAWVSAVHRYDDGRYDEAVTLLDGVLEAQPENLYAWLLRGTSHYLLGKEDLARTDLTKATGGDAWVTVEELGGLRGVLTKSDEVALASALRDGSALLAVLHTQDGRLDDARMVMERARKEYGDSPGLRAADAFVQFGSDPNGAIETLREVATDPLAQQVIGTLAEREQLPAELVNVAKHWTIPYNAAVQHARKGDPAACVEVIAARVASDAALDAEGKQRLYALGYDCAALAMDVARADAWLAQVEAPVVSSSLNHVVARLEGGDPDGADALLKTLAPSGATDILRKAELEVAILARRGDLDTALANKDKAPPRVRFYLGNELVRAGRYADAGALLRDTCPHLPDADKAPCAGLLQQLEAQGF